MKNSEFGEFIWSLLLLLSEGEYCGLSEEEQRSTTERVTELMQKTGFAYAVHNLSEVSFFIILNSCL